MTADRKSISITVGCCNETEIFQVFYAHVGLFFFSFVQLFFIGIIGEYLGAAWTHVRNCPLVIEEERINFQKRGAA